MNESHELLWNVQLELEGWVNHHILMTAAVRRSHIYEWRVDKRLNTTSWRVTHCQQPGFLLLLWRSCLEKKKKSSRCTLDVVFMRKLILFSQNNDNWTSSTSLDHPNLLRNSKKIKSVLYSNQYITVSHLLCSFKLEKKKNPGNFNNTTTMWNEFKHLLLWFEFTALAAWVKGTGTWKCYYSRFRQIKLQTHTQWRNCNPSVSVIHTTPPTPRLLRTMVCHFIWSHTAHKVWKWFWGNICQVIKKFVFFLQTKLQVSHHLPQNEAAGGAAAGTFIPSAILSCCNQIKFSEELKLQLHQILKYT